MLQTLSCRMDIAAEYGADAAIFLNNIVYWTLKNKAEKQHFHDGRYWMYATIKGLAELYPLWSAPQIKRIIAKLRAGGALLVGDYNEDRQVRTCWYAPSDEILALYDDGIDALNKRRNRKMAGTKSENGRYEIGKCNKEQVDTTSRDIPPIVPQRGTPDMDMFERFWLAYPASRHVHKDRAARAWKKLNPNMALCQRMSSALEAQKRSPQWTKDGGEYIPHPSTWLNGRYWEAESPVPPKASGSEEDPWDGVY